MTLMQDVGRGASGAADYLALGRIYRQLRSIETDVKKREVLDSKAVAAYEKVSFAPDPTTGQLRAAAEFFLEQGLFAKTEILLRRISGTRSLGHRQHDRYSTLALRVRFLARSEGEQRAIEEVDRFAEGGPRKRR